MSSYNGVKITTGLCWPQLKMKIRLSQMTPSLLSSLHITEPYIHCIEYDKRKPPYRLHIFQDRFKYFESSVMQYCLV